MKTKSARIIEPKRHTEGHLYHNCPKIGENIVLLECGGCPFYVDVEKLTSRYRLYCDYPVDGPELREFEPARAHDRVKKFVGDGVFDSPEHTVLQPKLDGVRAIIHCFMFDDEPKVVITSRRKNKQGRYNQFQDNVPHIRDHKSLIKLCKQGYTILDSEIIAPVDDDTLGITMGIVGSLPERAIAHQEKIGYAFLSIFDVIHWQGVDVTPHTLTLRQSLLEKIKTNKYIKLTPTGNIKEVEARRRLADEFLTYGYEGAILKNPDAGYFESRAWLKWKEKVTVDVLVTGWEKGAAGGRYSHTLGALKVSVIDNATGELREIASVIPGDDNTRAAWYERLNQLDDERILQLRQIIELEGQTWTKDGRIRHPRVLRFRIDRSEPNIMDFAHSHPIVV